MSLGWTGRPPPEQLVVQGPRCELVPRDHQAEETEFLGRGGTVGWLYRHLGGRIGRQRAISAIARELAGFVWAIGQALPPAALMPA